MISDSKCTVCSQHGVDTPADTKAVVDSKYVPVCFDCANELDDGTIRSEEE